jgi:hypothetical protein
MKHGMKYMALVGSMALLAGCGGGGDGDRVNADYVALAAEAEAAAEGIVDTETGALAAGVEARTSLPNSGTASYDGYVGGEVGGAGLVGELSLNVNFANNDTGTITGSATNFQHETDGAYAGTLTLEGGTIVPGGGGAGSSDSVAGDLDGNLTNGGTIYPTIIGLDGEFVGGTGMDIPTSIGGFAGGTVGLQDFTGTFIATMSP